MDSRSARVPRKILSVARRSRGDLRHRQRNRTASRNHAPASEDFSHFANETPGFFFFLGTVKPGTTSGDHHTPTFMADDGAVPVGMRAMSMVLLDYLQHEATRQH